MMPIEVISYGIDSGVPDRIGRLMADARQAQIWQSGGVLYDASRELRIRAKMLRDKVVSTER